MSRRPVEQQAREHTELAILTITDVMINSIEPRDRLAAAKEILDRGHGKPLSATVSIPASRAQAAMLASMSDEELLRIVQEAPLPRLARMDPETVDAEFVEKKPDPLLA